MRTKHVTANTTDNCFGLFLLFWFGVFFAHSTFNRNTLQIKMKVENIFTDPGATPDADLSSYCAGSLALTTAMHKVLWPVGECVF